MSTGKAIFSIIGGVIAAVLVVMLLSLLFGWFGAGANIVSAQNVKEQHEQVIGKFNAMDASAKNACTVQSSAAKEDNGRAPTIVEDPMLAYSATFNRNVASYNNAVDNIFRAGIVAPPGYPESVDINYIDTTDWCTVSSQLQDLRR